MDAPGTISPLLDALARGAAAGATAAQQRAGADAAGALARLAGGSPADRAALAADALVVPALAAAICSRDADGAVVAQAMVAAVALFHTAPPQPGASSRTPSCAWARWRPRCSAWAREAASAARRRSS
jgi:hypothetical protein